MAVRFDIGGEIGELSEEAATLIAEDYRRLKDDPRWREIADPIEERLTGATDEPIRLTSDNAYLLLKPLNILRNGPLRDEAQRLLDLIVAST